MVETVSVWLRKQKYMLLHRIGKEVAEVFFIESAA